MRRYNDIIACKKFLAIYYKSRRKSKNNRRDIERIMNRNKKLDVKEWLRTACKQTFSSL